MKLDHRPQLTPYFAHPEAIVGSPHVGAGTRVWAFAHILPGARVGAECNICDGVFIENDVVVGDRVTVKCGVQIWDGITLEDDVFVGPNATFTNDPFPRSRQRAERFSRTVVRRGASIGANATLLPGIEIGAHAMIGAGAVVTRDVPPGAVVAGNPAREIGTIADPSYGETEPPRRLEVKMVELPVFQDERGDLTFAQVGDHLPFVARRYFVIMNVPPGKTRGEYAHTLVHQFLVCLRGACNVTIDDGSTVQRFRLESPRHGLYVPPLHWSRLDGFSGDALLLSVTSGEYDRAEYLEDYPSFMRIVGRQ